MTEHGYVANCKVIRRWCDHCGMLVLGDRCSCCGGSGREFFINSPGDIRPCMGDSRLLLEKLLTEAFGTAAPLAGKAVFFNKVPGEDRADEVVAEGEVIALLRFDLACDRPEIELRQPGAEFFAGAATKNVVTIAGIGGHLKGKAVPGANVADIRGVFAAGAPLIIRKALKVGPGVALTDSARLKDAEKAVRVRDLAAPVARPRSPAAGISNFVAVNREHLIQLERTAVQEIVGYLKSVSRKLPVTVSFSGGKDSLVAASLAVKAASRPALLFINTGLEFPETVQYAHDFAARAGLPLHVAEAGTAFWDNVDTFGPPAKDFRWCCKVCKLGPITDLIGREFPEGTVTVEGNRSLESFSRAGTPLVTKNPFVPNQINLNPVRDWCAAEIWGYIWLRELPYNPLYDRDFERIGCYLCASCLTSEWQNTGRLHPDMYRKWNDHLHRYAEKNGLPPEYIDLGFWRWKVLPPKMRQLAAGLELRTEPKGTGMSLKMLRGASVCVAGGYSMEAVATVPRKRDFSYVEDALRMVGTVKYEPEYEIALVKTSRGRARLFGGGQVSVTADTVSDAQYVFERAVKALIRAQLCTECGICVRTCVHNAIRIKGGLRVDPTRCVSCGKCEQSCMVIHYYDKIMAGQGSAPVPAACAAAPKRQTETFGQPPKKKRKTERRAERAAAASIRPKSKHLFR
ncbi:MAG: phosphoadenosine phosphosulfate reductase family protein [Candidatus Methanomethylophilus sp.]|nr:phosphoadenosine phosphosulfate reductase family protein [Methanomethylophilus sp.]